ncbi:IS1182 family transposase [Clostridium manihotivorum]|uniref:IS5/IS1182 family transposase n=1 Tax=Clostridium manihotivorum TaxID=2320868 RepID=A0A410E0B3_9CLOT|nr:IS1182 family transposase [Clostridium manihotivorum]QAA34755.1 IS5/IS1182 family transposase [Clostridium manihotivorum]
MLRNQSKQYSLYSILYHKIPDNHILKLIDQAVDFSFVNKLLESSYCKYYGRPAKEPEMMIRLLILQYLYNLSDKKIIEETSLNLASMWFVGLNPEEELPHPSLLAKFRVHRLQEVTMDEIIKEVVRQCVEKGIIKGHSISIDSTHTHANTGKLVPERVLKHLAKKILKNLEEEKGAIPEDIDANIPDYKAIDDHKVAKETMKAYLEDLMEKAENHIENPDTSATAAVINNAREIIFDEKFIQQKRVRSLVDQDARVGNKSKTDSFFGYKTEFIMTTGSERIITAVAVHDGTYVDGTGFKELYELTKEAGIEAEEVYGDKAYFRKPILDLIKEDQAEAYIPVSESVYRIDESKFNYNKDSDQWYCKHGNNTVKKKAKINKSGKKSFRYTFDKEICKDCPHRSECINGKMSARTLEVGVNAHEYYEYSQRAKTQESLEKYKNRSCQEWKNGEMKRFHGLDRAKGYGLRSMGMQARLTALAVNLKRIAKLVSSFLLDILNFLTNKGCLIYLY